MSTTQTQMQNIVNQRQAQMLESNMGPELMEFMHDETITELMLDRKSVV